LVPDVKIGLICRQQYLASATEGRFAESGDVKKKKKIKKKFSRNYKINIEIFCHKKSPHMSQFFIYFKIGKNSTIFVGREK
jgi:hypothetical protein